MSADDPRGDELFDPALPADDELARLQAALAPFRHEHRALPPLGAQQPAPVDEASPSPSTRSGRPSPTARPSLARLLPWAAAAGLLLMVWGALESSDEAVPLRVTAGEGLVGGRKLAPGVALRAGDALQVADGLDVAVGALGSLRLGPDARLVVLAAAGEARCRLALDAGRLDAVIHATPRLFQVTTPAGLAVDMGCAYRAEVDADGHTVLTVSEGLVTFTGAGRTVWVPAGARLRAHPDARPATPLWDDTPGVLAKACDLLDHVAGSPDPGDLDEALDGDVRQALDAVLAVSAPRDGLLLWHLIDHPWRAVRDEAGRALAALIPPPTLVPADDPAAADEHARRAWLARVQYEW